MPAQPNYFGHLFWPLGDLDGAICLNTEVKWIFLSMLGLLQVLSMIWFGIITKVVGGVLKGESAEDTQSDDEEEGEEEEEEEIDYRDKKTSTETKPLNMTDLTVCMGGSNLKESGKRIPTLSPKSRPVSVRRRMMDAENRKELRQPAMNNDKWHYSDKTPGCWSG